MSRYPELDLKAAEQAWGAHPISWPRPPRQRPSWWQFGERRTLGRLEAMFDQLSNEALARYYEQARLGQSAYEDAGGYLLRCYRAMLGLPIEPHVSEADVIEDLLRKVGDRQ